LRYLATGETSTVSGPSGVLYQISGSTLVSIGGEAISTRSLPIERSYFMSRGESQLGAPMSPLISPVPADLFFWRCAGG
jgi:hypothetical protein